MKAPAFKATEVVETSDGEFTLAIDMEIIDALEDDFDCGFDEIMGRFRGNVRIGKLARLLRGLLSRHHPDLSLDDTGALAMAYGTEFGDGMGRLFVKAQPDAKASKGGGAKAENPPKPRSGARKASSRHGAAPA